MLNNEEMLNILNMQRSMALVGQLSQYERERETSERRSTPTPLCVDQKSREIQRIFFVTMATAPSRLKHTHICGINTDARARLFLDEKSYEYAIGCIETDQYPCTTPQATRISLLFLHRN